MSSESARGTTPASRSGCLIALYVLLGAGALMLVLAAVGAWVFLRSETGQRVREAVTTGITLTREAGRAPGTDALRAAGCSQALVIPTERVLELVGGLAPDVRTDTSDRGPFSEALVVLCQLETVDETAPDCAEVARVYAGAVPDGPERFGVLVQGEGRRGTVCEGAYGRDGSLLEPLGQP